VLVDPFEQVSTQDSALLIDYGPLRFGQLYPDRSFVIVNNSTTPFEFMVNFFFFEALF